MGFTGIMGVDSQEEIEGIYTRVRKVAIECGDPAVLDDTIMAFIETLTPREAYIAGAVTYSIMVTAVEKLFGGR